MDIIIDWKYSERHFLPTKKNDLYFSSAGQIAKRIYDVLSSFGIVNLLRNNQTSNGDVLFVQGFKFFEMKKINSNKIIYFFPASHPRFTKKIINKEAKKNKLDIGGYNYYLSNNKIRKFNKFINNRVSTLVLIGNNTVKQTFLDEKISDNKIVITNSGIDFNHFYCSKRNTSSINFVFNSTYHSLLKGTPYLLGAWNKINKVFSNKIKLYILGMKDPSYNADFNLKNIEYIGKFESGSNSYIEILNKCHYVIAPSLSEGQMGSLLEAMSCGCVPIATENTGINVCEYNGYKIETASIMSIVDVITSLINDFNNQEWEKRSFYTRQYLKENHDWNSFKQTIKNILIDE